MYTHVRAGFTENQFRKIFITKFIEQPQKMMQRKWSVEGTLVVLRTI